VVLGVLEHHPHRALTHLRGKPTRSAMTEPIFSRLGASGKPGAVHHHARRVKGRRICSGFRITLMLDRNSLGPVLRITARGLASATPSCYSHSIASSEEGLRTHAVTAMVAEGSWTPLTSTT
jgi:hypothetical protein